MHAGHVAVQALRAQALGVADPALLARRVLDPSCRLRLLAWTGRAGCLAGRGSVWEARLDPYLYAEEEGLGPRLERGRL